MPVCLPERPCPEVPRTPQVQPDVEERRCSDRQQPVEAARDRLRHSALSPPMARVLLLHHAAAVCLGEAAHCRLKRSAPSPTVAQVLLLHRVASVCWSGHGMIQAVARDQHRRQRSSCPALQVSQPNAVVQHHCSRLMVQFSLWIVKHLYFWNDLSCPSLSQYRIPQTCCGPRAAVETKKVQPESRCGCAAPWLVWN